MICGALMIHVQSIIEYADEEFYEENKKDKEMPLEVQEIMVNISLYEMMTEHMKGLKNSNMIAFFSQWQAFSYIATLR